MLLTSLGRPTPQMEQHIALQPIANALTEATFDSMISLVQAIKHNCTHHGFAASIIRSDNKRCRVIVACDMSGEYRNYLNLNEETRQRKAGSRKTDCHFRVFSRGSILNGAEQRRIIKCVEYHNHDPANKLSGHPSARRMDANDKQKVRDMT